MSFRHAVALRGQKCLRGMKPGKIGGAACSETHAEGGRRFVKQLAGFAQISGGLRRHKSMPSRRISCMRGVRSR
jgi:hypothetical protein